MKRYTIHCTEQQTRKALELGAPINKVCFALADNWQDEIPTAEEMIGWLDEQGIQTTVHINTFNEWDCYLYEKDRPGFSMRTGSFESRKDALLAAIDAALDYLAKEEQL